MPKRTILGGSAAAAAFLMPLMTGSAALADVTAQDVWSDWKSYMSSFGYQVTGTETTSGDTLTVSDITMNFPLPEDAGAATLLMEQLAFTNRGDGTVALAMPPSQTMRVTVAPKGEDPVNIGLNYVNEGLVSVISGAPNDMTYTYSAKRIALSLGDVTVNGQPLPIGNGSFDATDLTGSSNVKTGNLRDIKQSMSAGQIAYDLDFANPDNPAETFKLNGTLGQIAYSGGGTYPIGQFDSTDLAAMLKAGFSFDGAFSYSGGNTNFRFNDSSGEVIGTSSSDSGRADIAMSQDTIKYVLGSRGQAVNFSGPDVPIPIDIKLAESLFKLIVPISKSDETRDFQIGLTLGGFETSDMIWGLLDPAGQLPHTPATIAIDLSGKGKLAFDVMDPAQQEAVGRGEIAVPGEIESLALNNLEVTAAGASLTGKGSFMFDFPTVMQSQGTKGIDGALDLMLTGANGLMQKLVEMGLVPQDQAMGMQMMMGMFAVPAGEDVYSSKLEVKPDGQILANGQRLQ